MRMKLVLLHNCGRARGSARPGSRRSLVRMAQPPGPCRYFILVAQRLRQRGDGAMQMTRQQPAGGIDVGALEGLEDQPVLTLRLSGSGAPTSMPPAGCWRVICIA